MANIEVGDKVRFLNEVGQGRVTRIQGNIVYVYTDEGFEIPMNSKQLVVVEKNAYQPQKQIVNDADTMNYNYAEREEKKFEMDDFSIPTIEPSEPLTDDIYLAFVHEDGLKNEELNLYIINDSNNNFTFCLFNRLINSHKFIDTAHIEAGSKLFINHLTKEDIAQTSSYTVQGILYNPSENKTGKIINKELKVSSLYLLNINYFKENEFFDEPAFLMSIIQAEKNQENIKKQKIQDDQKELISKPKSEIEKPELIEVDLHIPELVDDYKDLTPSEMLGIQINHFRKKLEECILTPTVKRVVFIHGVGNGTLKLELRKILTHEYSHYDYQDASFKEYGYGATMVILRR
ncbi:MAG TPA: DUF2027 domain-containing protein [Bacteroidales bacterium]|nr:DUF2027 domain-containing protein [Bacteroidales bacterium]